MVTKPAERRSSTVVQTPVRRRKISADLLKLSLRQAKYRKFRLQGMSIYRAAKAAGYSESYARSTASRKLERQVKASIFDAAELVGADNMRHMEELFIIATTAMKRDSCTVEITEADNGDLVVENDSKIEVPDYTARLKAWEQIGKLKKLISAPFEKAMEDVDFTRLVIVVEKQAKEQAKKEKDGKLPGRGNTSNVKTKSRVVLSNK